MNLTLSVIHVTLVTTFYRMILLCGNYSKVIILYENSTKATLEPVMLSLGAFSSVKINVDLMQQNSNPNFYSDEHSLIILVFDNTAMSKTTKTLMQYHFKKYCHYLFVSTDSMNVLAVNIKILRIAKRNKLDNVGLILVSSKGTLQLFHMIYDQFSFNMIIGLPTNDCSIYPKIFYSKTKDFKGENKYVYFTFDPPRAINLTSRNEDGKEVISMGGRYAYLASLIPRKMKISLKMCTSRFSADHKVGTPENAFFERFMEKTYAADKQLDYITILRPNRPSFFTKHPPVISLESTYSKLIHITSTMYFLYPHEMVKYHMVVGNQIERKSTLLAALIQMPLISVWALAILIFAVSRKIVRSVLGTKYNYFGTVVFNTFGTSFGTAGESPNVAANSSSENLLILFLSVFAMLANILFSGMLFTEFSTSLLMPRIDSLEDLAQNPYIEVWIPIEFDISATTWLQQQIPNRIHRAGTLPILSMVYSKNTSAAFFIDENKADLILGSDDMVVNGQKLFHIINFSGVSQLLSFFVREWWAIEPMNELVQQTIEYGLMMHFERRTKRIMHIKDVQTLANQNEFLTTSISMKELIFVFIIYAIVVSSSIIVFAAEHLVCKYNRQFWRDLYERISTLFS